MALTYSATPGHVGNPEAYLGWALVTTALLSAGLVPLRQLRQQRRFSFAEGVGGATVFSPERPLSDVDQCCAVRFDVAGILPTKRP